jgi:type VII secretion protein EccE
MSTTQAPPAAPKHRSSNGTVQPAVRAPRPAGPRPRGSAGGGGGIAFRLVLIELAAVCVIVTARRVAWWSLLLDGLVLLALVAGFSRVSGEWWLQWIGLRRAYSRRCAVAVAVAQQVGGSELAVIGGLAGQLEVQTVENRGVPVGVAQDSGGWFAVIELDPRTDLRADAPPAPLRHSVLVGLLDDRTTAPSTVQVVTHTVPSPTALLSGSVPAIWSYRSRLNASVIPASQVSWVALRLSSDDAPTVASGQADGVAGIPRAVAAMAVRASRGLTAAGFSCQVLDSTGLAAALARSCVVSGVPAGQPAAEAWTAWHAEGLAHTTFAIVDWPAGPAPEDSGLVELYAIPGVGMSLAVTVAAQGDGVVMRALVRVVAPPTLLAGACEQLLTVARRAGIRLRRLDGRHGPAAYASAPTGGGAR